MHQFYSRIPKNAPNVSHSPKTSKTFHPAPSQCPKKTPSIFKRRAIWKRFDARHQKSLFQCRTLSTKLLCSFERSSVIPSLKSLTGTYWQFKIYLWMFLLSQVPLDYWFCLYVYVLFDICPREKKKFKICY